MGGNAPELVIIHNDFLLVIPYVIATFNIPIIVKLSILLNRNHSDSHR